MTTTKQHTATKKASVESMMFEYQSEIDMLKESNVKLLGYVEHFEKTLFGKQDKIEALLGACRVAATHLAASEETNSHIRGAKFILEEAIHTAQANQ